MGTDIHFSPLALTHALPFLPLAQGDIDYQVDRRGEPGLIDELLAEPTTKVVLTRGGLVAVPRGQGELVDYENVKMRLATLPGAYVSAELARYPEAVAMFLGSYVGARGDSVVTVDITRVPEAGVPGVGGIAGVGGAVGGVLPVPGLVEGGDRFGAGALVLDGVHALDARHQPARVAAFGDDAPCGVDDMRNDFPVRRVSSADGYARFAFHGFTLPPAEWCTGCKSPNWYIWQSLPADLCDIELRTPVR